MISSLFLFVEFHVRSVCRLIGNESEYWKNGPVDRGAIWDNEWGGSKESCVRWRAHWRHLANMIEQLCTAAMSGPDT